MLYLRRLHLYTGITLAPWVLLYGISGFLFNHPDVGGVDRSENRSNELDLSGTSFGQALDTNAIAFAVVESLSNRFDPVPVPAVLADPPNVVFGSSFTYELETEDAMHYLDLDLGEGEGMYFKEMREDDGSEPSSPLDREGLAPDLGALLQTSRWHEEARSLLVSQGISEDDAAQLEQPSGPVISFDVLLYGETYRAFYDVGDERLSAKAVRRGDGMNTATFLKELHKTHTYPRGGIPWVWALLVDVMAVSMVCWGLSGLLMWWQLRKTRKIGAVLVAVGLGTASMVAIGMYSHFGS